MNSTPALSRLTAALHEELLPERGNYLVSALGVHALLAMALRNAEHISAATRADLADFLGVGEEQLPLVAQEAQEVLDALSEDTSFAAAGWFSSWMADHEATADFAAANPDTVKLHLPMEEVLDAWVQKHSKGIMDSFPEVGPDVYGILASMMAVDISWTAPYEIVDEPEAMSSWAVSAVLAKGHVGTNAEGFSTRLVRDPESGLLLGVHEAESKTGGVSVASMIGDASEVELLALNERYAQNPESFEAVEPRELEWTNTPNWLIIQDDWTARSEDVYEVFLPAWKMEQTHEIPEGGALFVLVRALLEGSMGAEARGSGVNLSQAVKASYGATGFKAAALTTMMISRAAAPARQHNYRVRIYFDRTYSVVAKDASGATIFSGVVWEAELPR